jgi:hypothetical protein
MKFYTLGQLSNSEKSDILNKHKELYNGYRQVYQPVSNTQDLFVQDFANDKEGLVVNNKGEVKPYTNFGINEQTEMSLDEIRPEDLQKGKKYKYKTPSFDDTLDFEDEVDFDDRGEKMFKFKGEKAKSHLMGDKHIEDFLSDFDDEMEEGIYDVEDLDPNEKFDYVEEKSFEPMESAFSDENLDEITGPSPLYSEVDPPYEFKSDGPMQAKGPYHQNEGFMDDEDDEDDEEIDFDLFRAPKFPKGKKESELWSQIKRSPYEIEDIEWEDIEDEKKPSFMEQKKKIDEMFNRFKKYN